VPCMQVGQLLSPPGSGVASPVPRLLLCGGLASNAWLRQEVEARLGDAVRLVPPLEQPHVAVLQGELGCCCGCWAAARPRDHA
jgi:hypothetical protein